jgi:hypothetical protein
MLAAEEENESEVRRVDQDNINQFARLNARLQDARNERERLKVRLVQYSVTLLYPSLTVMLASYLLVVGFEGGMDACMHAWIQMCFYVPSTQF